MAFTFWKSYSLPYIRSVEVREFLAEFLGIMVLCVIGNGSIAQQILSRKNDFLSINLAYGVGVTFGVYCAFGVSGGHLNPAVTISQAVIGKFPLYKIPIFLSAQYLGAFVSAIIVYYIYLDAITHIDGGVRAIGGENGTAGIFATYPQPYVKNVTAFFDQVVGTSLLLIGILSLTNEKNVSLRVKSLEPLVIGFLVTAIGLSYGINCGYAINPARDLAPRIFTAMVGYGGGVFSTANYYFWIPVVGPHTGAIVGTLLYKFLVGMHFAHDMELLAGVAGAEDNAARVGKGNADPENAESGKSSPPPQDGTTSNGTVTRERPPTASRQMTVAPQYIIGEQNSFLRPNTLARQQTYAPNQTPQRKVMWRQNSAASLRNVPSHLFGNDNPEAVEILDMEAVSPALTRRGNRMLSVPSMPDSKRPAI